MTLSNKRKVANLVIPAFLLFAPFSEVLASSSYMDDLNNCLVKNLPSNLPKRYAPSVAEELVKKCKEPFYRLHSADLGRYLTAQERQQADEALFEYSLEFIDSAIKFFYKK